jgi:hypothetical protein
MPGTPKVSLVIDLIGYIQARADEILNIVNLIGSAIVINNRVFE